MPSDHVESMRSEGATLSALGALRAAIRRRSCPASTSTAGRCCRLPGHADGHLALMRDGVLIAGDAMLATITPERRPLPGRAPDPLGDYLDSLARIAELAPAIAFAGHGRTIEDPTGAGARARSRTTRSGSSATGAALGGDARTAYDVSLVLFPDPLPRGLRRFALAETRAHLEYLVLRDRATRVAEDGRTAYASR